MEEQGLCDDGQGFSDEQISEPFFGWWKPFFNDENHFFRDENHFLMMKTTFLLMKTKIYWLKPLWTTFNHFEPLF